MNHSTKTEHSTVLIGPTYLAEIESIKWHHATVKYLRKRRGGEERGRGERIYYDVGSIQECIANQPVDDEIVRLILGFNEDTNCFLLAERERKSFFDGAFLAPIEIANCARYAWSVLKANEPELIVFHNHPHELFTYVLLKLALHLNIPTWLVHFSALPWRMCISRYSKDGSTSKLRIWDEPTEVERRSIENYMTRLQSSHEDAIPDADLRLLAPRRSALYVGDELLSLVRGSVTKSLLRIARKISVYRAFKCCVTDEVRKPYVVFLMHYQPEESTLPRGGVFVQQLNAILRLRALLPADVNILVKENRATFRAALTLATAVRNREFYWAVAGVPATHFVSLKRDTFELIDNALAVATITGSVGLEALCRGKRVIVFGDANYKGFSGVTRLNSTDPHDCDLSGVIDGVAHDPSATARDLLGELLHSVGPAVEDNRTNFQSQQRATIQAFEYISGNVERVTGAL